MIHTFSIDSEYKEYHYKNFRIMVLSNKYIYVSAIGPNATPSSACCGIARVIFDEWAKIPFVTRVLKEFHEATGIEPIVEIDDNGETKYDGYYLHKNFVIALLEWTKNTRLKNAMERILQKINFS